MDTPKYLQELGESKNKIQRYLSVDQAETECKEKLEVSEKNFRWGMCR